VPRLLSAEGDVGAAVGHVDIVSHLNSPECW
jgi:hypothetical protein